MSKNVKLIVLSIVAVIGFYFLFSAILYDEDTSKNTTPHGNTFVVPEVKEDQKTKEQLYEERRRKQGRVAKSENIEELFSVPFKDTTEKNNVGLLAKAEEPTITQQVFTTPKAEDSPPSKNAGGGNRQMNNTKNSSIASMPKKDDVLAVARNQTQNTQQNPSDIPASSGGQTIRIGGNSNASTPNTSSGSISFSAVVFGDHPITQRGIVKVRTLEEFAVDGVKIPRNTIMSATAQASGQTIDLGIASFIYNGISIRLNVVAYTAEGKGISYHSTEARRNIKEGVASVVGSAVSEVTNSTSIGNAVGGTLDRTARGAATAQTVTIPDGFKLTFLQQQ